MDDQLQQLELCVGQLSDNDKKHLKGVVEDYLHAIEVRFESGTINDDEFDSLYTSYTKILNKINEVSL